MCSETKSLLPTAKDSCRPSVIVIDGSTQPNGCLPGPSSSWKNQPSCSYIGTPEVLELEREPKRRARADFARMMMEESLSDSSDESQNECDSDNDVMINDT